jgi:hypothetical protein
MFALIPFVLMAVMAGGGYWYYNDSQERIGQLRENNALLVDANKANVATLEAKQEEYEAMQAMMNQLDMQLEAATQDRKRLVGLLRKHNLSNLAAKKPGLIEKRINNASDKLFTDITNFTSN